MDEMDDSQRFVRLVVISSLIYGFMILIYPTLRDETDEICYKYKNNLWYTYIIDIYVTWTKFSTSKKLEYEKKEELLNYLKEKNKEIILEQFKNINNYDDDIQFPIYVSKRKRQLEFKTS